MSEHEAGRELDALIAERVFGLRMSERGLLDRIPLDGKYGGVELPHYSTDIAEAWQAVEKMRERDAFLELRTVPATGGFWIAEFTNPDVGTIGKEGFAETASLAICRAALAAIGFGSLGGFGSLAR